MKTNPTALRCALLVSALSLCTAVSAESTSSSSSSSTQPRSTSSSTASAQGNLNRNDRNFFEKAAMSGMKEVTVSQAAMNHLVNPQVKQFAQMMVSDHTSANAELMSLASNKGVTLPVKEQTDLMEKWSKKTDEVDEDYMEQMVSDHEESVELFQSATKSSDPAIAAFAAKTLPKLQQHLTMAKDLLKQVD